MSCAMLLLLLLLLRCWWRLGWVTSLRNGCLVRARSIGRSGSTSRWRLDCQRAFRISFPVPLRLSAARER
uniref:Putative secreted protein n=1 Tax=Anopheles triannulatus TaxID=58253 RepID=A0A2M4B6C0_9DIPT